MDLRAIRMVDKSHFDALKGSANDIVVNEHAPWVWASRIWFEESYSNIVT